MMCPAVGIEIPTPAAICGSSPMVANSVVPMANPPIASANNAGPARRCGVRSSVVTTEIKASGAAEVQDMFQAPEPTANLPLPIVVRRVEQVIVSLDLHP